VFADISNAAVNSHELKFEELEGVDRFQVLAMEGVVERVSGVDDQLEQGQPVDEQAGRGSIVEYCPQG
jgi:hypothetical protein